MLQNITKYIFSILLLSTLVACGSKKNAELESSDKLPKVREEVLVNRLDSLSKQRPDYFYAKLSSKYSDSKFNVSFKTSIRMVADSALHALITFARIPIYNVMVTPDSVTLVDKRNNCYMQENMQYLKTTFGVDFKHKNIEELILGMPIAWDKKNMEYDIVRDPYNYVVYSTPKRKTWRQDNDNEMVFRYFLSSDTKSLEKIIIDSPKDTTTITINYYGREMIEGYSIPLEGDINVQTARDKLFVDFKYNKTSANEPRVLYLAIPNKYERCE